MEIVTSANLPGHSHDGPTGILFGSDDFFHKAIKAVRNVVGNQIVLHALHAISPKLVASAKPAIDGDISSLLDRVTEYAPGELLWNLNKSVENPIDRQRIVKELISLLPTSEPELEGCAAQAAELRQTGFVGLPNLVDEQKLKELSSFLSTRNSFMQDGPTYENQRLDVVAAPHALSIATDPKVLNLVNDFLGGPPTIVGLSAWWTVPTVSNEYGAHVFHRDKDDFRACKLFLYLTDVETDDGPHIFARFTHDDQSMRALLEQKGVPLQKASTLYKGNGRHLAPEIQELFRENIFEITGKAGTAFLESTYGFHRGKTPKRNRRGLFQVLYALVAYPMRIKEFSKAKLGKLPANCVDSPQARYAARLML